MIAHYDPDEPYWHRAAPLDDAEGEALPAKVDVCVIGAGFTGLSCGLELAKLGRDVLVLDAKRPGFGASTRNGGMVGWGHRLSLASLSKRYGEDAAKGILSEGPSSLAFTRGLIAREGIECQLQDTGRFLGAASPKHFEAIKRDVTEVFQPLGENCRIVEPEDLNQETSTQIYCGGAVFENHAALHPGQFHKGLLDATKRAGARVQGQTPVIALSREDDGWRVETKRGTVQAGEIVYAANAYGQAFSKALKQFGRRLLPVPSFIIATEALGENRVKELMPGGRTYVDTRSSHSYYRASPDGQRILWGGRASLVPTPRDKASHRVQRHMTSVFPSLSEVKTELVWTGFVAFTRDGIPHLGQLDGIWFAGGYNGSGVAMAPYLGWRLAQKIAGTEDAASPLDATQLGRFPPNALMPLAMRSIEYWHRWKDRRDGVVAPIDWR